MMNPKNSRTNSGNGQLMDCYSLTLEYSPKVFMFKMCSLLFWLECEMSPTA